MPCNSAPRPEFSREDMDAVEIYYQAEIDRVTKAACEAIKILRRNALYDTLSPESQAWSHEHDAWDAARDLIERSVRATVRKATFDANGEPIKYYDDENYQPLSDDDISALRIKEFGEEFAVDQELSRQVFEDLAYEWTETTQEGDDDLDEALDDETPEPQA